MASYDAFISYSHTTDGGLAAAIREGLQKLAKPWNKRRALNIFLDQAALEVSPGLKDSLHRKLAGAEWLILLLSQESARSEWVGEEIAHWIATKSTQRIALVHTGGELCWGNGDFDWQRSSAAPRALKGVFAEEPLWLDLRKYRDESDLDIRSNNRFKEDIATVAAAIHGISKEELAGEDLAQFHRARRLRRIAIIGLVVLTVIAVISAVAAVLQTMEADRQRDAAVREARVATSRQAAANAQILTGGLRHDVALLLAAEGHRIGEGQAEGEPATMLEQSTTQAFEALLGAVARWPGFSSHLRGHERAVRAVAISSDGSVIASADAGGSIALWNSDTGERLEGVLLYESIPGARVSSEPIRPLALSADGATFAAITGLNGSNVWVWEASGVRKMSDPGIWRPATIAALDFENLSLSADGRTLAAGTVSGVVLWETDTGEHIATFSEGGDAALLGPNGEMLVTGNHHAIKLVNVGDPDSTLAELDRWLRFGAAFSPDGTTVALVGRRDGTSGIWLFDVDRSRFREPIVLAQPASSLAFSPDGQRLVATLGPEDGPQMVTVWDIESQDNQKHARAAQTPAIAVAGTAVHASGSIFAVAPSPNGALVWDVAADPIPGTAIRDGEAIAVSADGSTVAFGLRNAPKGPFESVTVLDVLSGREATFELSNGGGSGAVAPDGRFATFTNGNVVLWDGRRGSAESQAKILGQGDSEFDGGTFLVFNAIAFDPTGRLLAWPFGESVVIWNVAQGVEERRIHNGYEGYFSIEFSSDGSLVGIEENDHIEVWQTTGSAEPTTFPSVGPFLLLPEQGLLVGSTLGNDSMGTFSTLQFWSLDMGIEMRRTAVTRGEVGALAIALDGSLIAAGYDNGLIRFWNVETAEEVGEPFRGNGPVTDLAFGSDEAGAIQILAATERGAVVWAFNPAAWTASVCAMTRRNLTPGENGEYVKFVGTAIEYHETCPGLPTVAPKPRSSATEITASGESSDLP